MISKHVAGLEDSAGVAPRAIMKEISLKASVNLNENVCVGSLSQ